MENHAQKTKLNIRPIIEQKPFENQRFTHVFNMWCERNDSIKPQIVSRGEWEEREKKGNILEKMSDNTQNLYYPSDLNLWEMVKIFKKVDHDTFKAKPEQQVKAKERIDELGKTFQHTGVYIAQRLDSIGKGHDTATELAIDLYEYGQSLTTGNKPEKPTAISDIASLNLTSIEIATVDRFLNLDTLYSSRFEKEIAKAETPPAPDKKDELYESIRTKTLAQYFRALELALELKHQSEMGSLKKSKVRLKPWQRHSLPHDTFISKTEKYLTQQIETPKRELMDSFFLRGMDLLQKNMPFDKLPEWVKKSVIHLQNGEITLREALGINKMTEELTNVRDSGDTDRISEVERRIADRIQTAIQGYNYEKYSDNPSENIKNQTINCLSATMLGGALLHELGINYLVGVVPNHATFFLVTKNGQVEWRDMLMTPGTNFDLTDDMIKGTEKNGSPITVADIVKFSKKPNPQGLWFDLETSNYKYRIPDFKLGQRQHITMFGPEDGQKIASLNNLGYILNKQGLYEEASEAYRQVITLEPNYTPPYVGFGNTLFKLGNYKGAVEICRKGISIDPENPDLYFNLGCRIYGLSETQNESESYRKTLKEEALDTLNKAVSIDQKLALGYFNIGVILYELNRNDEAGEAMHKFISVADIKKDREILLKLENDLSKYGFSETESRKLRTEIYVKLYSHTNPININEAYISPTSASRDVTWQQLVNERGLPVREITDPKSWLEEQIEYYDKKGRDYATTAQSYRNALKKLS